MSFPFNVYLLAIASACVTVLAALPLWRRWCLRTGLIDEPGHRKIHDQPIPLAVCATKAVPATPFAELEARFAAMFDVVVYCDVDDAGDTAKRQVTEISVVPPQLTTAAGGVAVTPIFSRTDIGEDMELRTGAVGDRLERRCDRLLARYGLDLAAVLKGAEVRW